MYCKSVRYVSQMNSNANTRHAEMEEWNGKVRRGRGGEGAHPTPTTTTTSEVDDAFGIQNPITYSNAITDQSLIIRRCFENQVDNENHQNQLHKGPAVQACMSKNTPPAPP